MQSLKRVTFLSIWPTYNLELVTEFSGKLIYNLCGESLPIESLLYSSKSYLGEKGSFENSFVWIDYFPYISLKTEFLLSFDYLPFNLLTSEICTCDSCIDLDLSLSYESLF